MYVKGKGTEAGNYKRNSSNKCNARGKGTLLQKMANLSPLISSFFLLYSVSMQRISIIVSL